MAVTLKMMRDEMVTVLKKMNETSLNLKNGANQKWVCDITNKNGVNFSSQSFVEREHTSLQIKEGTRRKFTTTRHLRQIRPQPTRLSWLPPSWDDRVRDHQQQAVKNCKTTKYLVNLSIVI